MNDIVTNVLSEKVILLTAENNETKIWLEIKPGRSFPYCVYAESKKGKNTDCVFYYTLYFAKRYFSKLLKRHEFTSVYAKS